MMYLQDTDLENVIHVIPDVTDADLPPDRCRGTVGRLHDTACAHSDQVTPLAEAEPKTRAKALALRRRLAHRRRRSQALDTAVILGAVSGALTCGTVLALFLGALRAKATAAILFVLFGLAICCTIGALTAFLTEMLRAGRGLRADVTRHEERLE